ncbi:MAG: hypothetical protein K6F50_03025 [Kiritimatiellae bacterium]|nr:hypothetical protein [Kiritimatiellia bacterium]
MTSFAVDSLFLFFALRAGDFVNLAAGLWFVPKYVSQEELGAVLPVTSFATFLALPVFSLAMAVMKESACLHAAGERGRLKSLLRGVFASVSLATAAAILAAWIFAPRFLRAMGVSSSCAGFLAVSAALLGCSSPVFTDALQAMKRFGALAAAEIAGSAVRFAVLLLAMPFFALEGYFLGAAALPLSRIALSSFFLRRDLSVKSEPFWTRPAVRRVAFAFFAILAYQALPMGADLAEQSVLRASLSSADSAGYYMATRIPSFLHYLSFPLLLVMFPYTAAAAQKGERIAPYVLKCIAATFLAAAILAAVCIFFGARLISLMPNGAAYASCARHLPLLVLATALASAQVFITNAAVSAGRFSFLLWFAPLHLVYSAALVFASGKGLFSSLDSLVAVFAAFSAVRFILSLFVLLSDRAAPPEAENGKIG